MEGKHWVRLCDFLLYKPRHFPDASKIKGRGLNYGYFFSNHLLYSSWNYVGYELC